MLRFSIGFAEFIGDRCPNNAATNNIYVLFDILYILYILTQFTDSDKITATWELYSCSQSC